MPLNGILKRLILCYMNLISTKKVPINSPAQRSLPPALSGRSAPFPRPGQTPDLPRGARRNPEWEVGNLGARGQQHPGCVPVQLPVAPGPVGVQPMPFRED